MKMIEGQEEEIKPVPVEASGGSNIRGTVGYISKDQFLFMHTIGQGAYG